MLMNNLLEFPLEVLNNIWWFCNKKSLINFSSCSKDCRELVLPLLYEQIKIYGNQSEKTKGLLPRDRLKYVKHLSFEGPNAWSFKGTGNNKEIVNWKDDARYFQSVINSCDSQKVKTLSIVTNEYFGSDMMIYIFANFVNLKKVKLQWTNELTRYGFFCLSNLKFLTIIKLCAVHFPGSDFSDFTALIELSIDSCTGVTDQIIDGIAHNHGLEKLTLSHNGTNINHIDEQSLTYDLEKLKGLRMLKYLNVIYSEFSEHQHVTESFHNLQTLLASECIVSSYLLDSICSASGLTDLAMQETGMTDDQLLLLLKKLNHLKVLRVSTAITDIGLKYIGQKVSLLDLSINDNPISDDGIQHLSTLVLLKEIALFGCEELTDKSLMYLSVLPSLNELSIDDEEHRTNGEGNKFSKKALDEWKKMKGWKYDFV